MKNKINILATCTFALYLMSSCASTTTQNSNKVDSKTSNDSLSQIASLPKHPIYSNAPITVFEMKILNENEQVRAINKPTMAALDFAAYYNNPIRLAGSSEAPENFTNKMKNVELKDYPFDMLDSLSEYEPNAVAGLFPLAWEPLSKLLYSKTGNDSLSILLNSIETVKWGESEVFRSFQTVSRIWGVIANGQTEWWVEISPASWTGRSVFYGKLKYTSKKNSPEILQHYIEQELSLNEALDWARTLSSYWYPTLNTDLEQHTPGAPWKIGSPFAILRGNPMGTPIYIGFESKSFTLSSDALEAMVKDSIKNATETILTNRAIDTSSNFRLQTLSAMQNSCPENAETQKFKDNLSNTLAKLPKEQNAWEHNGMLWFKRNANYLLASDITKQDSLHNPLPRLLELKHYLDSLNIQLLIVPIPVKEEIYPEKLIDGTSENLCVNTSGRNFIQQMLLSGLDVLDIYPALMATKMGDEPPNYSYQRNDTHWSLTGMLSTMELLAAKVTSYSWYAQSNARPGSLTMQQTTTIREGDLIAHLPDSEKAKYTADTLPAMKIFKDNEPYKGSKNAPILLIGDSFTGVFESVDQKSGGPGSLLAYATGLDVQVSTSWGGGPGVYQRIPKMQMQSKRLVIYMMTARDFWQSPMEWDTLR